MLLDAAFAFPDIERAGRDRRAASIAVRKHRYQHAAAEFHQALDAADRIRRREGGRVHDLDAEVRARREGHVAQNRADIRRREFSRRRPALKGQRAPRAAPTVIVPAFCQLGRAAVLAARSVPPLTVVVPR